MAPRYMTRMMPYVVNRYDTEDKDKKDGAGRYCGAIRQVPSKADVDDLSFLVVLLHGLRYYFLTSSIFNYIMVPTYFCVV